MSKVTNQMVSFSMWLRRPERFVGKLQALYNGQSFPLMCDLEQLATRHGIEVIEWPLPPSVEGMTTWDEGQPVILLRHGLAPYNRRFVLAHELGHVFLHASHASGIEELTAYVPGGNMDVEADAFALVCLVQSLPDDGTLREGLKYMFTNHNMARRALRVIRYCSGYKLRILTAKVLDRLLFYSVEKGIS
jgi:Zn-dependent peptidase ImmA (M78 family)